MAESDERYEAEARSWLESVDAPPFRLDTGQLIQMGRTRARRRRYLAVGGATVMALAVAAALPAAMQVWPSGTGPSVGGPGWDPPQPSGQFSLPTLDCSEITVLDLPDHPERGTPDPTHVWVRDMDPTGRYVLATWVAGEVTGTNERQLDLLWDTEDGTATYLPTRVDADGQAVNAAGVVVGSFWDGEGYEPWIYRDEQVEALPVPEGYQSAQATAVTETGDAWGIAGDATGFAAVVIWPADNPDQPEVLTAPASANHLPYGSAGDGAVVVNIEGHGPYYWDADRVGHWLPLPEGALAAGVAAVGGDWAVGTVTLAISAASMEPVPASGLPSDLASLAPDSPDGAGREVTVPIRWNLRSGTVEVVESVATRYGIAYGVPSGAIAVSAAGDLIISHPVQAVVRDDGSYTLPAPAEGGVPEPVAISENGAVFAGTVRPEGGTQGSGPVVWRC